MNNKKNILNSVIVNPNKSISFAIKKLEKNHKKILFIAKNKRLLGVFEDSDLRRALIKKKNLNNKIASIANLDPKFLFKSSFSEYKLKKLFASYNCVAVPILDKNKKILKIEFNKSIYQSDKTKNLDTAFIMAGGLGKRLSPITNKIPKPIVKYKSKPILEYIVENLIRNKIKKIYLSVNYKKEKIISYIKKKKFKCDISLIKEKKFLGTAGSLFFIKKEKIDDLFVINGDMITNLNISNLFKYHKDNNLDLTAVTKIVKFQIPYGVVKTKNIYLKSLEEKPTFVGSVLIGAYILNRKCVKLLKEKKLDMTELIDICIRKRFKIGYYPTYEKYLHITFVKDLK